ncbi:putative K(+)-stimulated pyrophosphate-energized sodium pump 1 [Periplaneta americana]|uniref:putative K(+)-stimulated pyrophosphate-energized sodium pump 1 n=1 Tax=Periplaneta americana TaxID=6978 RepID=UPI0037E999B9
MGITGTALGLLGIALVLLMDTSHPYLNLVAFGFGACVLGLFSRVGGGIYTKAADVGADLVGKIEAGIPEDDPRNPAVIADNVGDNVGDIAGMGADIFASYVNALVATMILGLAFQSNSLPFFYPLIIMFIGFVSSLLTMLLMNFNRNIEPAKLVRYAPLLTSFFTIVGTFIHSSYTDLSTLNEKSYIPSIVVALGIVGGTLIGLVTEWYTSGKPVRDIANASLAGGGSNAIRGISVGMESSFIPAVIIIIMILVANYFLGAYGIGLAAVGMLSTMAITTTIDGYGPISDNAGGIAEMSELGEDIRNITDKLDAVGNTTAAIGKGFAIGSTSLTALALVAAFTNQIIQKVGFDTNILNISDPFIIVGLLAGGIIVFLFSALTMRAVGDTALSMVEEVRRQFKTIPGLMEGTATPDYKACVSISTKAALKQMIIPGFLTIIIPLIAIFAFPMHGLSVLSGVVIGTLITGIFMALFMSNAGGAWDNAKKYIEAGKLAGHKKGSDAHKAAVLGDTIGDPFKDTSGPSLNIVIKIVATLALLILFI